MSMLRPDSVGIRQYKSRSAAFLFGVASLVTLLGLVLPHQPEVDTAGLAVVTVGAGLAAVGLMVAGHRLADRAYPLLLAFGTLLVGLALLSNGERNGGPPGGDELYFLLVVLYGAYYLERRRAIVVQVLLVAAAYAVSLAIIAPGPIAVSRWLTLVGLVSVTAVIVRLLVERVEHLIANLAATARTDSLTGLLNRRAFEERLQEEITVSRDTGRPLTLLLADLDRFKELNDSWGHVAGDQALTEVGRALRSGVRPIDAPARLGGDEFAVVLPDMERDAAEAVAAKLSEAVRDSGRAVGLALEWSVGIAALRPSTVGSEDLMRVADIALYANKGVPSPEAVQTSGVVGESQSAAGTWYVHSNAAS